MCLGLSDFTVQFNAKFENEYEMLNEISDTAIYIPPYIEHSPRLPPQCVNQVVVNLSITINRSKYKLYLMYVRILIVFYFLIPQFGFRI